MSQRRTRDTSRRSKRRATSGFERGQTSVLGANNGVTGTADVFPKPRGYGVSANETVFNGNRTLNRIRQAESQVFGAREQLRNTEQNTLLSALTAYMDVLEDTAILGLDRNNVDVLKEQLRETRDRSPSARSRAPTSLRRKRASQARRRLR